MFRRKDDRKPLTSEALGVFLHRLPFGDSNFSAKLIIIRQ